MTSSRVGPFTRSNAFSCQENDVQARLFGVALTWCCLLALPGVARPQDELVGLVLDLLKEQDKEVRSLAFEQIRTEMKGEEATKQFAGMLTELQDDARIGLLSALADRGDVAAKPAILETLKASEKTPVVIAAMAAVGKLGDPSDSGTLVRRLSDSDQDIQAAARGALIRLQGDAMTKTLVGEFHRGPEPIKLAMIEILTARRAMDAIPDLISWSTSKTRSYRKAAMVALGQLGTVEHLPLMLPGVLKATRGPERSSAEKAVLLVARRESDAEKRAQPILDALASYSETERLHLLPTLGRVGGGAALRQVEAALKSSDTASHSAGIMAISHWPDASVADTLIALAKSDQHDNHRAIALRALIRVAPLADGRDDGEKLSLLKTVLGMANRDADKKLAIRRASAIRTVETLRFLLPYVETSTLAEDACHAIVELAHHRQLRDDNKPEFHAALDKVLATSKDATVLVRAERYKKGQTWARSQP